MMRTGFSRCLRLLLLGVAFLGLGQLRAVASAGFSIGDPNSGPTISVGEKDIYLIRVRAFEKPEQLSHVSYECVGKCKKHGQWYGRCLVTIDGKPAKPLLAPLRTDTDAQMEEMKRIVPLGTTQEKERGVHPWTRAALYRKKTMEVKDRTVLRKVYKNCLHYREDRYTNLASLEFWFAPNVGIVEATVRMNFGRKAQYFMNTKLESVQFSRHSS